MVHNTREVPHKRKPAGNKDQRERNMAQERMKGNNMLAGNTRALVHALRFPAAVAMAAWAEAARTRG
jgi:hypothetical protein